MTNVTSPVDIARGFASELGVDLDPDIQRFGILAPHLVVLDTHTENGPLAHITDENGADYYTARIDYDDSDKKIAASRAIVVVMQGHGTKFAYWPQGADPKELIVHRGHGSFIVGNPVGDEPDTDFNTDIFPIDAEVTPQIRLQPGRFYTLEAAEWSPEPLVVSVLSETDDKGKWEQTEVLVEPGVEVLKTPDGQIVVPEEFTTADFN